jgi:Kef-type K+ transport system membrane component KefB
VQESNSPFAQRFVKWLSYDVIFALFPIYAFFIVRSLVGASGNPLTKISPELLILVVVLCASSLGDVSEVNKPAGNLIFGIVTFVLTMGVIAATIIYTCIQLSNETGGAIPALEANAARATIWLAVGYLVFNAFVQYLVSRVEGRR